MDLNKHQKHANLVRRKKGLYAFNEIAILGSNCSNISNLVAKIGKKLQKTAKIAYLDASHDKALKAPIIDIFTSHSSGDLKIITKADLSKLTSSMRFTNYDLLFLNGNHFQGSKQILILDSEKEASVKKRLAQLDSIQFVVKKDKDSDFFDFLLKAYPNLKNIRSYDINDIDQISQHVENLILQEIAPVKGLVLAGGKSSRMGSDKTQLLYYNKPQLEHVKDLLEKNRMETFISVAHDQELEGYNLIKDKFIGLGVFGAICSAFQKDPNKAWFVLATDLPYVDNKLIKLILAKRNPKMLATTVKGISKEFVEPLITIYEPKAYPVLLSYLAQGYSCPRKMLINSAVEIVEVDDHFIKNVNTPEEYNQVKEQIKN